MDKASFFARVTEERNSEVFELAGEPIILREITSTQFIEASEEEDSATSDAILIMHSVDEFTEDDLDNIKRIPLRYTRPMAKKVLEISGIRTDSKEEGETEQGK